MIYFSHRGANTQRVQNTVEAFAFAHAQGARCFELDVQMLKDGNLVIHHDYSLLHTAGIDVEVGTLTYSDLKKYPLQNPFTTGQVYIPLLDEVLPIILPDLEVVNIELKNDKNRYPGLEEAVLKVVKKYPQLKKRVLFSSFDYACLQRLRRLAPKARIGLLTRCFDIQQALDIKAESVHMNYVQFTPQIAAQCHAHGLKMYLYVVNDSQDARRLTQQGADGFFTDRMDLFL